MSSAVSTTGLTRTFGEQVAVNQLDLKVAAGTLFGFLGPNGAGKSTTIKMLTGLLKITSGSAAIFDQDITRHPVDVKRRIGVVPEELALFDRLTGAEYLHFVGRMYGLDRAAIAERTDELLRLMELEDRKKLIVDFSHGMKKKLSISAALIHQPDLLFLDEPFEGIDAVASRLIKDLLASLVARGTTIFLTSHILEIVEKLCSEVAIIHQGQLIAQGSITDLRQGLGKDDSEPSDVETSLEELFLKLVQTDNGPQKSLSWLE